MSKGSGLLSRVESLISLIDACIGVSATHPNSKSHSNMEQMSINAHVSINDVSDLNDVNDELKIHVGVADYHDRNDLNMNYTSNKDNLMDESSIWNDDPYNDENDFVYVHSPSPPCEDDSFDPFDGFTSDYDDDDDNDDNFADESHSNLNIDNDYDSDDIDDTDNINNIPALGGSGVISRSDARDMSDSHPNSAESRINRNTNTNRKYGKRRGGLPRPRLTSQYSDNSGGLVFCDAHSELLQLSGLSLTNNRSNTSTTSDTSATSTTSATSGISTTSACTSNSISNSISMSYTSASASMKTNTITHRVGPLSQSRLSQLDQVDEENELIVTGFLRNIGSTNNVNVDSLISITTIISDYLLFE